MDKQFMTEESIYDREIKHCNTVLRKLPAPDLPIILSAGILVLDTVVTTIVELVLLEFH